MWRLKETRRLIEQWVHIWEVLLAYTLYLMQATNFFWEHLLEVNGNLKGIFESVTSYILSGHLWWNVQVQGMKVSMKSSSVDWELGARYSHMAFSFVERDLLPVNIVTCFKQCFLFVSVVGSSNHADVGIFQFSFRVRLAILPVFLLWNERLVPFSEVLSSLRQRSCYTCFNFFIGIAQF